MNGAFFRRSLVVATTLVLSQSPSQAEFVRGTINGFGAAHFMTQDATFGSIWKVTITATNTVSAGGLLFDQDGDYDPKWAKGSNASQNSTIGNAANGGADLDMGFTNGNRYSFGLAGSAADFNRAYVIMETAGNPVSISNVSPNVSVSTGAVPVTIQLSAGKSAQESIWVRMSTNSGFSSSLLIPSTGSSTNYTATLPAQTAGARVYFYVLSSTMPSNVITGSYDLCTLRGKNAGSSNFSFRAGTMNAWHFPTNAEPPGAYMRNPPTNGASPAQPIYFYSGSQTGGTGNAANQSGMALIHRLKGSSGWTTNSGGFDSNGGSVFNAFWIAAITGNTYTATNEVEYIIRVSATDHNTTYIGTTNGQNNRLFLTDAEAKALPFSFTYGAGAPSFNLGNAWHVPTNVEPPGVTMRNPINDAATNQAVFIYNGNQFQGAGNPGNQTGGTLYFRKVGDVSWISTALVFNSESGDVGNNKYWRGRIPPVFSATNEVEYYLAITYSDHDTTYLGTTNQLYSNTYGVESQARSNTFRYTYSGAAGSSAAFMFHNSNRVILNGTNVQFWVKIGYAEGIGTNRYIDYAAVYYTTDGSAPGGAYGVATNAGTQVAMMTFDHMEEDPYEGGDAMWWVGAVNGLPEQTLIKYRVGSYKATNGVERFADYNTSGTNNATFAFTLGNADTNVSLSINGLNADYTTSKFFVNEIAGETSEVVVVYRPGGVGVDKVEIFSNLDRRDLADVDYTNALISADGLPDGIVAPNANFLTTNDVGSYYRAFPMAPQGGGSYVWTGRVSKTGAYRLTGRYHVAGDPATNWTYYSSNGRRDHAIVVSPKKALEMTLYELNTLTTEATSDTEGGRSTFIDLLGAADGDNDGFDPFNLDYLNLIQANCLWFQPIHPVGVERSENDAATGQPYAPGSPYATRDYWSVTPKMGSGNTEASAMSEFTNFVAKCDSYTGSVGTINIMLDGVFNHTSWDALLGQGAVDLGFRESIGNVTTPVVSATTRIGNNRWYWYADSQVSYCDEADYYNSAYDNDFAVAPDRGDFGKWADVTELYFGRYAALVCMNPQDNGNYVNEGDWFEEASKTAGVIEIWKYFAYYAEYWIKKTGHAGTNSFTLAQDDKGIDGLRCDFGQGLPPQLWEYIINRTRSKKWNFVFMAETLDGGSPGYRSNRHFDILNESFVFQFTQAHISDSRDFVSSIESRRSAYNGGAILLNITSHDEVLPDNDPWLNASRYGAVSSVDGLPMIFYGQEHGIKNYNAIDTTFDGFTHHELNFGKFVPHFKKWNKLLVWDNPPPDSTGMAQWYGRVNWARLNSPALRSRNRFFLNTTGGGQDSRILAVAKYETPGASPATSDVVIAFTRFLEHGAAHSLAANTYNLQPAWSVLGLDTGKSYTVRNLAASDAFFEFTNGWPKTGADLYNNGLFVSLGAGTSGNITNDGEIVQYLKFVEVTGVPNQPPSITLPGPHTLVVGAVTNFGVSATDPDGGGVTLNMTVSPTGATFNSGTFSWTAASGYAGSSNTITFVADDNDAATNSVVTNSTYILVPFDSDSDGISDGWEFDFFATLTNGAGNDNDGDGINNFNEYVAGTQPTNSASRFVITSEVQSSGATNRLITVSTQPGKKYRIYFADGSVSNSASWTAFASTNDTVGTWTETNTAPSSFTFRDDEGPNTTTTAPVNGQRSYRVTVGNP